MKPTSLIVAVLLALAAAGAGGYWLGQRKTADMPAMAPQAGSQGPTQAPSTAEKKLLYYRNPMGLPDVSPVPKKDWMGMDYIPVYEGEETDAERGIRLTPQKIQTLGVRTEEARSRNLMRQVRATASVQYDERRQMDVTVRYEGWIEKLLVNATGEPVKAGQVLMQIYSPAMVQAQEEYLLALTLRDTAGQREDGLEQGAIARLRNLGLPQAALERLQRSHQVSRQFAVTAPMSGLVAEKTVIEGMRIQPGDKLYRLIDDSQMWLLAEVFEQDLGLVQPGQQVAIQVNAYPGRRFQGLVAYIYPGLNRDTRTARVRIEVPNPERLLKSEMYASVELATEAGSDILAVPESAVIDSGLRQTVLVDIGLGRFEPRAVKLGRRGDGYVEIRDGVEEGEAVVVQANFLLDAEANLRAALQSFTPPTGATPQTGDIPGRDRQEIPK